MLHRMNRQVQIGDNGVTGPSGAGAPSSFFPWRQPDTVPAVVMGDAALTLELHAALDRVAAEAAGPLGRERVRTRCPLADPATVRAALQEVAEALALIDRGAPFQVPAVPDVRDSLARLRGEGSVLDPEEFLAIRDLLAGGREVGALLRAIPAPGPDQESGEGGMPALRRYLAPLPPRTLEERLGRAIDDDGRVRDDASPVLRGLRRDVHHARERLIQQLEALCRAGDGGGDGGGVTLRHGRYVIPVRRDDRRRPPGIVHDESASAETLFIEPTAAIELANALRSAVAAEGREVLRILRELTGLLRAQREVLEGVLEMCVALDDIAARARYARRVGATVPRVGSAAGPLIIRQGRHPLLLGEGRDVVPFDLVLDGTERTLLVSGPNTGGKTVLLKAVGLMTLLVQCGIAPPVGAESVIPVVRAVFADIGDHQSIAANLSTFSAHVGTLRRILAEADGESLVLIDEIGSGTDPVEGAALARAALAALTRRGVRTIATTHLGSLKSLAVGETRVVNGSLQFDTETLAPSYRFQKGVPGRSYGLAIARRLGVDPEVLEAAEREVPDAERALETLLARVEQRDAALDIREREVAALQQDLHGRRDRLAAREAAVAAREEEVARAAREAENGARRAARAYLLEARKTVEAAIAEARAPGDAGDGGDPARLARQRVEEAIRAAVPGEEEHGEDETAGHDGEGGGVAPGDRVRLAGGATGVVLEPRGEDRWVVQAGALKVVVASDALVRLRGPAPIAPRREAASLDRETPVAPSEIDLRGLRSEEAEAATVAALDAAILAELPHLRIIHGMGTGVVRDRVRRLLTADRRVAGFTFAPRAQGGTGVTIVEFAG